MVMDERRGERFGRYEILAELGRGAVGVVYKARDPKINRVVAIKTFLLSGQAPEDEEDFRARFVREAEAAGRLSHPGIVTIFDVGEEPETRAPYIVMEYVGGQSLDKVLAANDNTLPLETALQLAHELAEALDCAHGQGVVHRDLKPANILITEEGHAKIADFGVAKLNLANQTLAGRALGTPAYMSPEQLNGETVDGRSDLFSLGVVLYTVLTGYRPFQGNSAMTVSYKVVNREPVPATVLDTELPPGIDYVIGRAMAKDPAQRYQRGMELALDIQDLRAGRELWSRAKQVGGSPAVGLQPAVTGAAAKPAGQFKVPAAAANRPASQPHHRNGLAAALLREMHRKSFAAVLLLIGLAVFAWRVAPLARTKRPSRANTLNNRIAGPLVVTGDLVVPRAKALLTESVSPLPAATPVEQASTHPARTTVPSIRKVPRVAAIRPASGIKAPPSSPAPVVEPATLDIEVEHKFPEATLSIWVDSRLSYTHTLEGTDKKRLVVFHSVQGHEFHAMQVPPGNHELRVEVTSSSSSPAEHSATVQSEFLSGKEKTLRVIFDKHGEMNLSLE
jgi:tRNA A-37 threonylcarbamoyl transferase component Bud32